MTDSRINRRTALASLGTVGLGSLLAACTASDTPTTSATVPTTGGASATVAPQTASTALDDLFAGAASCTATPEQTEGPYYFDVNSIRSDIREDRAGVPLHLAVRVQSASACAAIANAVVDIWHCDAIGEYSGFESATLGGPGGGGRTDQKTYLRGAQVTNAAGIVEFLTVYPGWYRGRTVHIHAKVHLDASRVLTTQFYFDENVSTAVYGQAPYNQHSGRDTFNSGDGIFRSATMLTLRRDGDGYLGLITIGVA
jgi:protocatechuate 3,4-dioxygenase beta subunit